MGKYNKKRAALMLTGTLVLTGAISSIPMPVFQNGMAAVVYAAEGTTYSTVKGVANFDAEPRPTEEELLQMFANSKKDMKKSQNMEKRLEESPREEEKSNVPKFGTLEKLENPEKWDLSGSVNQCILRYAARLNEDQINEILLGLENGLTEKQVKTYFILPADKMKQYRRAYEFANE